MGLIDCLYRIITDQHTTNIKIEWFEDRQNDCLAYWMNEWMNDVLTTELLNEWINRLMNNIIVILVHKEEYK